MHLTLTNPRLPGLLYVSLYSQSRILLLPGLCAIDLCWPSLGFFTFDVNRTDCAILCVGLYVQSRNVLLQELCAFDVRWPSLGLCAFGVNRTRLAALLNVSLYLQSRNVLLPGLCTCLLYTSPSPRDS